MDITKSYKACVKAAKVKGKMLSPDRILPTAKEKNYNGDSFDKRAVDVVRNISKLRDYLFSCQTDYIGEFSPLVSISSRMSDDERQQIENDAQTVLTSCSNAITALKHEVEGLHLSNQGQTHALVVLEILDAYLKDICKLYSQQRAFRVKQAVDQKRMARLKPENSNNNTAKDDVEVKDKIPKQSVSSSSIESRNDENIDLRQTSSTLLSDSSSFASTTSQEKKFEEVEFTQEETQMFQEENERLYEEMNNIVKEVQNIEGKVVAIGKLQEIFQEKVLAQADQIECINDTTVSTTENVKEGNENIREAIKNSASFRVWILFFLVMCTFSLLFLDWYND